jgi:hypothetical protein
MVWDRAFQNAKLLTELERRLVDQTFTKSNQLLTWLRQLDELRPATQDG